MSSTDVLDLLRALVRTPGAFFWAAVAWTLDQLRHLEALETGLLVLGLVAVAVGLALWLQRQLREEVLQAVEASGGPATLRFRDLLRLELSHAPALLPFKPFELLVRALRAIGRGIAWLWRRIVRRQGRSSVGETHRAPQPAHLVASLGPSLLLAAAISAGLYLLALGLDPLLSARWDLSEGLSAWQFLAFGYRPELAWYLPLDRFPYLASVLAVLFWLAVWSLVATVVRLARWRSLASNLHDRRRDPETLPFWRRWAGTRDLWRPAAPYLEWARWPVLAAIPLLGWAWLALAGDPYRLPPGAFAVALVLWMSWGLHLVLRGAEHDEQLATTPEPESQRPPGWKDVCDDLEARFQVVVPEPFPQVPVIPLKQPAIDGGAGRFLSPLVTELLGWTTGAGSSSDGIGAGGARLTVMQREVLETLALQGYVHMDPPSPGQHLALGRAEPDAIQDRGGMRSRNQVVLAPEGSGKTTLALLAVANHALVHTRSSLVITSTPERAERLSRRFREAIEPSPLRWNVRLRTPGPDLMSDLSRGIVPDVVVTGLHDLVVTLLDRTDSFASFLSTVGLIVVDDVESFAGPCEVHAQLAFRRLVLRVEELTETEDLGGRDLAAPQVLVLGAESMHEASEWAQSLCGIDAVTRFYDREGSERELGATAPEPPATHCVVRLRDLRSATGELLSMSDLIRACEKVGVPWHYRLCGDGRRDLGRGPLLLEEEPRHAVDTPEEACVLLLHGTWSDVRRERERLSRAGLGFAARRRRDGADGGPEPIGVVTVAEPDLDMAFTQLDRRFALAPVLDSLPRPVLRPPTGRAILPHLTAELTQHWTEVGDVVQIFGAPSSKILRRLGREHLLLAEERKDVDRKADRYVRRVYVQALSRAIETPLEGASAGPATEPLLPPKVSQVELVVPDALEIRDRTSLVTLGRTGAAGADILYYPGRIFEDARGRFVVVGRSDEEIEGRGGASSHARAAILVEPILSDSLSSPRRRLCVTPLEPAGFEHLRQAAGGAFFGPERTLFGRYPVLIALQPVRITTDHIATYRLGPIHCEVRQRSILDSETRRRTEAVPLETVALAILPNPATDDPGRQATPGSAPPALDLSGARVLAATMRAVLPSLYRGAADGVDVALHLNRGGDRDDDQDEPGDGLPGDRELDPDEGFYLFDADSGGNGTARAIYRDGIDLLLRLCRLTLERVLPLGRLRNLHDQWGALADILAEAAETPEEDEPIESIARRNHEEDQALRRKVLDWLDSRLQTEGGAESRHELARLHERVSQGDGPSIDLGRCWYSVDGAATDLVWAKHRWHPPQMGEAKLDVGFDRKTLADTRHLFGIDLAERRAAFRERIDENPDNKLDDGIFRGRPSPVFLRKTGDASARPARADRPDHRGGDAGTPFDDLQLRIWALAAASRPPLRHLARHLAEVAGQGVARAGLEELLWRFVQGIPNATGTAAGSPLPVPAPPVSTVLERFGNSASQALLLAVLLDLNGLPAGVFASIEEGRVLGAVASSDTSKAPLYGELPPPRSHAGGAPTRFLPVDTGHYNRPEETVIRNPESWMFLPLIGLPELPQADPRTEPEATGETPGDDDA